ncbi:MAG TPA: LCP family protein [Acidimicrobiia bacterium]
MSTSKRKKRMLVASGAVLVLLIGTITALAYQAWNDVNRVDIDRPTPAAPPPEANEEEPEEEFPLPPETEGVSIYLLVGSDSREDLDSLDGFGDFEGQRADVVMVLIRVQGGAALLSVPRDLLVDDPCRESQTRVNSLLAGCPSGINGPTLLTLAVEELIGERVDHYAMVDMAGFQELVDGLGGYEICVDRPVRDTRSGLDLPAGCTMADGGQTLAWLRSRHTQELTEDGWRTMAGVSDLARNERQRQFVIDMMSRLSDFSSPQQLASRARTLAPFVTVDSRLSFTDAVGLAWAMRGISAGNVEELTIPVRSATADNGASVLVATDDIAEIVATFIDTHRQTMSGTPSPG